MAWWSWKRLQREESLPSLIGKLNETMLRLAHILKPFDGMIGPNGQVFIGDDANANNTFGVTINQLAAADQILSFKSSDIAHGLTISAETDTYGGFKKRSATLGGLDILALAENGALTDVLVFNVLGGTADTTKSTAGRALCEVYVSEHDGSNALADITADGNVFGVRARVGSADVMRWLVDEDGDTWQAGGITATSLNLGGSTVLDIITGTAAWDPGNLIVGASATTTITVTGAATGDGVFVDNPFIQDDNELVLTAYVSGANTVTVSLVNAGLAAIDAVQRTVRAVVFKF